MQNYGRIVPPRLADAEINFEGMSKDVSVCEACYSILNSRRHFAIIPLSNAIVPIRWIVGDFSEFLNITCHTRATI